MIKIEFPADRPDIARAFARGLDAIGAADQYAVDVWETGSEDSVPSEAPLDDSATGATEHVQAQLDPKPASIFEPSEPAGTAEAAGTVGTAQQTTQPEGTPAGVRKDVHGVAFEAKYCAAAKDPYYATGQRSGQWKRRKGISQDEYDAWYAYELNKAKVGGVPDGQPVDAGAAFGAPTTPATPPAPTTTGDFMGWVSEKQAAGLLTQTDVGKAYHDCDLDVTALFPPTTDVEITSNIAKLYGALNASLE